MKTLSYLLSITLLVTGLTATAQEKEEGGEAKEESKMVEWSHDPAHTQIQFSVDHLGISEVSGQFEAFGMTVKTKNENTWEGADVSVAISAKSINTGVKKRDKHLKKEAFLYVEEHPRINFKSDSLYKVGENKYKMKGTLEIRGERQEATLDVQHKGTVQDPYGRTVAAFDVRGTINRHDFGITWNKELDSGNMMVGKEVRLHAKVELIKQ